MPDIKREELYRKFGPVLIEAIILSFKDEINLICAEIGLPERTENQILESVEIKLSSLELYEWMKKQED